MIKNGCSLWLTYVTFLNYFNKLNFPMQGRNTNIIKFVDALKAFTLKLSKWKRKIRMQYYSILEKLDIQGVHILSSQFQKFTIVLFFNIFAIGLFYSKKKMLQVYVRCFSTTLRVHHQLHARYPTHIRFLAVFLLTYLQ